MPKLIIPILQAKASLFVCVLLLMLGCGSAMAQVNAPSNLVADVSVGEQITLTWVDNSTNESGFLLGIKLPGELNFSVLGTIAANTTTASFTAAPVVAPGYEFIVVAYVGSDPFANQSSPSNSAFANPFLKSPTNLTANVSTPERIVLSWTDNSGLEGNYEVQFRFVGDANYVTLDYTVANTTTYTVNGVPPRAIQFRVRATRGGGPDFFSSFGNEVTTTTTLAAPTNLSGSSPGEGKFNITWTDNSVVEGNYELEVRVKNTASPNVFQRYAYYDFGTTDTTAPIDNTTSTVTHANQDIVPGRTYEFRVRATFGSGPNVLSAYSDITEIAVPFSAPTNLAAAPGVESAVNLTWTDNSSAEQGYAIYFKLSSATSYVLYNYSLANATSYSVTGLIPGAAYDFQVAAAYQVDTNTVVESARSSTASATTPFAAPTGLTGSSPSEGLFNVSWTDNSSNEGNYELQFRVKDTGTFQTYAYYDANTTSKTNLPVTPGQTYEFRVRATFGSQAEYQSAFSSTVDIIVPFLAPSGLTATASSESAVGLTWTDNSSIEGGYAVYFKTSASATYTLYDYTAANATSYSFTGLLPGTTYDFQVAGAFQVSANNIAESARSNTATVATKDGFVSNPYAPITLNQPFSYQAVVSTGSARTSWNITGLPAGLTFNSGSGTLTGTPTVAGVFTCPMTATFADGWTANKNLVLRVIRAPGAPVVGTAFTATSLNPSGSATVSLTDKFADPDAESAVRVQTNLGNMDFILYNTATPQTVANFLSYVNAAVNNFNGAVFHRSETGFVIQGGSFKVQSAPNNFTKTPTTASPVNEPGISNLRGTVAMAKLPGDPNSATTDFFISLADNSSNLDNQNGGFTVFARVAGNGMTVADAIAALPKVSQTVNVNGTARTDLTNWPVTSGSAMDTTKMVTMTSLAPVPVLSYSITGNTNPAAISASISGSDLLLNALAGGQSTLTITATDLDGGTVSQTLSVTVGEVPAITSGSPTSTGTVGTPYSFTCTASGVPAPTFAVASGALPGGLSLSSAGEITGTPTSAGTFTGTITASNAAGTSPPQNFSITIAKAPATVVLGNLSQSYNGNARSATASTTPAGLTVEFTYNGSNTAPTNAGSYAVVATINDANYTGTASGTLVVSKATAPVVLGGLAQTYNGNPRQATASTTPAGLTVEFTYNGSGTAPTNVGSYAVVATINDANYTGTANGTLVISKATAPVVLGSLAQTYNGNARSATASTTPAGLTVEFTYNGSSTAPTNAGSYAVVATINDANYTGTASGTLVVSKATAPVVLGGLAQTYNGNPRQATASTTPEGLIVSITYDGSGTAPTNAGSYAVVATISDTNYEGTANDTMVVSKATAPVVLGGLAQAYNGNPRSATTSTTPEGLIVSITYDGSSTAPANAGSYAVVATISDANYEGTANGTLVISKATAPVVLGGLSQTYNGNPRQATASTTPDGLIVSITYDGSSTAPANVGSYAVVAAVSDANYEGTANGTLVISKATAPIVLGNLSQTYNGNPRQATASTTPDGLIVSITYNGSTTAPTNAGSYAVVATISDANYEGTATGTLTISGGQTISAWRTAQFTPTQISNGQAANNADPDNDGYVNLAEYGMGTNPNAHTPPLTFTLDANGLSLVFTRPRDLPDVTYGVQSSENLTSWSSVPLEVVSDGPVQTVRARDPLNSGSPDRRFIQLIFGTP